MLTLCLLHAAAGEHKRKTQSSLIIRRIFHNLLWHQPYGRNSQRQSGFLDPGHPGLFVFSGDTNSDFHQEYLKKFESFLYKHEAFFQYCMSGNSRHDRLYFTRTGSLIRNVNSDETFTTGFDNKLGRFLAYQLLRDYIQSLLVKESGNLPTHPVLSWTESKVSLIELAYALYASGALDNGKTSIKQIISVLEKCTGLDLSNYRRIFVDIRLRKTGPSEFLDRLSEQYKQYIDSIG